MFHIHWDKSVQECGVSIIEDCSGYSWKHARVITPSRAYQILDILLVRKIQISIMYVRFISFSSKVSSKENFIDAGRYALDN